MKRLPQRTRSAPRCRPNLAAMAGGSPRTGTTLTEVLVSILVMSIGIVSLTSIFPLSLSRSIRAAQLTSATISRYNCDSMLDVDKTILAAVPVNTKAIIDPIGHNVMSTEHAALKDVFGNDGTAVSGTLARLNGGRATLDKADFLVTLPDSWTLLYEGAGSGLSSTQVTVANLSGTLPSMPTNLVKVTVFYEGQGRLLSASRIASSITGDTISWTDGLPAGITNVGMVRVEQQNRNYTWIVTARRDTGVNVSLDVTVFFRRSFSVEDETVHTATFTNGTRDVAVTFAGGTTPKGLKKGSYVFDPDNAFWYQVLDLKSQTSTSVTLELDRPAAASSPGGSGHAIFMRGIVEVFHIEDKKI